MFEKVNPSHPDKIADRIAGAIVDLAYTKEENPKVAVEVLIGHGACAIIVETSTDIDYEEIKSAANRIAGCELDFDILVVPQDKHLAGNQDGKIRCGDNGIFKGVPMTHEQAYLSGFAHALYADLPYDGKYIIDEGKITVCQSNDGGNYDYSKYTTRKTVVNPLGPWTGGINVDSGATNRKLGSDMGDSITGGGLHGKDLSKADVSVNIYAWLKAQELGETVEMCCAIGDECVEGIPYADIVETARRFIKSVGGFEKFAEWGLI